MPSKKISELDTITTLSSNDLFLIERPDGSNKTINKSNLSNNLVNELSLLQKVYPIGAIYLSSIAIDPATLFGFGEWEQIQDQFLLGAGANHALGETGGEENITLTIDQMPNHNHNLLRQKWYAADGSSNSPGTEVANSASGTIYGQTSTTTALYRTFVDIEVKGGNQSHNNMPPYITIHIWKRVK